MRKEISRKRRVNAKRRIQKRIHRLTAGFFLILISCLTFGVFFVSAHEKDYGPSHTYYKSIVIQPGDTLWAIAEDTMPSEYHSTAEYVEVLKDMNGLLTDDIQSGQNLIIAYSD